MSGVEASGKVLLVTGGSRGIGASICLKAAQTGWRVVVNYVANEGAAKSLAADITSKGGVAEIVQGDAGTEAGIAAIFSAVDERFGRLDGFVNNAGVVDAPQRVEDYSWARLERMFAINTIGPFHAAGQAARRMSTAHGGKGGAIVNMSSAAAQIGAPNQYVDYAASKAAIETLTLGLAKELATEGVRVNAVRPGVIETEIHASGGRPDLPSQIAATIPMQRTGRPDEVADAVLFLLSDQASYITGAFLNVSGGR